MTNFMRAAINAKREYEGKEPLNAGDFMKIMVMGLVFFCAGIFQMEDSKI